MCLVENMYMQTLIVKAFRVNYCIHKILNKKSIKGKYRQFECKNLRFLQFKRDHLNFE